jgi:hypothetical protein
MHSTFPSTFETSAADSALVREPLAVVAPTGAALNNETFIAYKETNLGSGAWRVRVDAPKATGAVLYPNAMRLQARATSARGKNWFIWSDTAGPRPLKFRVHVNNGQPAAIEILRAALGTEKRTRDRKNRLKFLWPES